MRFSFPVNWRKTAFVACHILFQLASDRAEVENSVRWEYNCATGWLRGWLRSSLLPPGWDIPPTARTHSQIFLICRTHFRKHFYGTSPTSPPQNGDILHLTLSHKFTNTEIPTCHIQIWLQYCMCSAHKFIFIVLYINLNNFVAAPESGNLEPDFNTRHDWLGGWGRLWLIDA